MKTKEFIGTCVENPFNDRDTLSEIVQKGQEITRQTFLKHCIIDGRTLQWMRRFPNDYYFAKSGNIYFYEWSRIEHFYN